MTSDKTNDVRTPLLPMSSCESDTVLYIEKCAVIPHQKAHGAKGLAFVAAAAVCFSLVSTCVKFASLHGATSTEVIFWRALVAFALNYMCIWFNGTSLYVAPADRAMMLMQCVFGLATVVFGFYAISLLVLADASVITFTSPLFAFFFGACLLNERFDIITLVCALVASFGIVCVLRPHFLFGEQMINDTTSATVWIGRGSALLAAITQAFLYLTVRKLTNIHAQVVVHFLMLFSVIVTGFYLHFTQQFTFEMKYVVWIAMIGCGVFAFLGQTLLTRGFQLEEAGKAAIMRYLDVVCVLLWDTLLLGERVNDTTIAGAVIICSSAAALTLRRVRHVGQG